LVVLEDSGVDVCICYLIRLYVFTALSIALSIYAEYSTDSG
jgi:hypothetical protein